MSDKQHSLTMLREMFDRWEALLAGLSEAQLTAPQLPSDWSIKDEIVHLWAWQQRSIAWLEATMQNREPEFPRWPSGLDAESEEDTDRNNAAIYAANRDRSWANVYHDWRTGFLRFMELGEGLPEEALTEKGKYPWLGDYPLVVILDSSYAHHDEHFGHVLTWLWQHGKMKLVE